MEELLEAIPALFVIIISIAASAAGNQKKKQREAAKRQTVSFPAGGAPFAGPAAPVKPAAPAKPAAPVAKPLVQEPSAPTVSAMQAESLSGEKEIMPGADEVYQRAETQVHAHLTPACADHEDEGSLDYASPEGVDPCHEEALRGTDAPLPPLPEAAPAQGNFRLKLDAENLTQAFVMQEILKRPQERRSAYQRPLARPRG